MKTRHVVVALLAFGMTGLAQAQMPMPVSQPRDASAGLPPGSPTIDNIRKRGKLLVGNKFGFPTFNVIDASGRNQGYMADLARALAKQMLGDENKVEFRQTSDETRFEMIDRNEIDVVIDVTPPSDEKARHADFSDEIFRSGSGLLVKKGSPITSVTDLRKGTRVLYHTENKDAKGLKARAPEATYIGFAESEQAFAALQAGRGDVVMHVVTHLYRDASRNPDYVVVSRFTDKPYVMAVKKGDTVMRDYVNEFLRSMKSSGEYDALFAKWFAPYGGLAAK